MMNGLLECLEADGTICQEEGFKQEMLVIDTIVDNPPGGGLIT